MSSTGLGAHFAPLQEAQPLKEAAYQMLQRMIITGELHPGERLRETELAERFAMSRGPIREAIQMLVADNWLTIQPRYGTYVKNPDVAEVEHHFEVKKLLEVESARLAAKNITSEKMHHLEDLLDQGFRALKENEKLFDLNVAFHLAIGSSSGNPVLSGLIEQVEKQLRFYFVLVSGLRNDDAWLEHQQLVQALAARDGDRAAKLMLDHTENIQTAFRNSRAALGITD